MIDKLRISFIKQELQNAGFSRLKVVEGFSPITHFCVIITHKDSPTLPPRLLKSIQTIFDIDKSLDENVYFCSPLKTKLYVVVHRGNPLFNEKLDAYSRQQLGSVSLPSAPEVTMVDTSSEIV